MSHSYQADQVHTLDVVQSQPIDARAFLTTCALCSLGGLTVLAGLAQTLVWFWGPVV
jgi:hypothetical protein